MTFTSKLLGVALIVAGLTVVGAGTAQAETIEFEIEICWTSGDLDGTSSFGTGTFDDTNLTGSGFEDLWTDDDDLMFDFIVDGTSYDEETLSFPGPWRLTLKDGEYFGFGFSSDDAKFYLSDDGAWFGGSEGEIKFSFVDGTDPVPEPGTWALMGLGMAGLVYQRRRKLKAKAS